MILQPIIDLVELCRRHGVSQAVISPGSRSAALTLAFARNSGIECTVVMDERAAGFIALGMAQQLRQPVALVCTSGSAAYNLAPAVAEAFFQQIPLVVLTADRPPEWINQNDGQTIFQENIYGEHVKQNVTLPVDYNHPDSVWYINRIVNESLLNCRQMPAGPVHLNVPIREPFYPEPEETFVPSTDLRVINRINTLADLDTQSWDKIKEEWEGSQRILIAVGQMNSSQYLQDILEKFQKEFHISVVGDSISNLSKNEWSINHQDLILQKNYQEDLAPDLLITIGQSFISKKLKRFLQDSRLIRHWHISEDQHVIDTFYSLTDQINTNPVLFLNRLYEGLNSQNPEQNEYNSRDRNYLKAWLAAERESIELLGDYLDNLTSLDDLTVVKYVLDSIVEPAQFQVANSMAIRYVNLLGIGKQNVNVFCNRGTSGIDGCVSTAIGAARVSEETVYLLVGDVAFFYDRNGLLMRDLPKNLKIILLNNAGGTIFRMIGGPARQPELETYFETRHEQNARRTAEDSKMTYYLVESLNYLKSYWNKFSEDGEPSILEIKTDPVESARVYKTLLRNSGKE